jgi:hypothetical protein
MSRISLLFVLFVSFLTGACASKQPQETPSLVITQQTQELSPSQPEAASLDTPVLAEPKAEQKTEQKTTVKPATSHEKGDSSSVSVPAEIPDPEILVKKARAKQTLSSAEPDKPSFKDEEVLPLEDRRLSPFAYEPVSDEEQPQTPWKNEELKYGLYYSFIKAGTAYIKNRGITNLNGKKAFLIQTTAFSAPVIDAVYKVRDVNLSWLDAKNFYSLGYAQSLREGSYKRDEWLTFDYDKNVYYGEVQKKKEPRVIFGELPIKVLDMLTSLYYVRSQKLEVGKDIVFDIVNREKQYPLVVKVLGKETIKTEAGKFNCIKVEPMFRGEGIFVSKGKSLQVWLTDDEYKMPVKMEVEVFIGSVYAELLEYKRN